MKKVLWSCVATLIVVALVLVYARYRYDIGRELSRVATGSAVAQTPCGPIEYASVGEGPAVLLVHGAGGGYDQMLDTARQLAEGGFRVVTMSRFGYLRTPLPPDASPAAQADAHACLLDALKIERASVIGVSAGGPSSMQFALRHAGRTAALVLVVPLAYAPQTAPRLLSPVARLVLEDALKYDFAYWAAMTFYPAGVTRSVLGTAPDIVAGANPGDRAYAMALMRHILPVSRRQHGLMNEQAVAASLARYDLERIGAPTLVVAAEDCGYGTYAGARYTADHVPNARFVGYPTGGHLLVGHQIEVWAQVTAFLGAPRTLGMTR